MAKLAVLEERLKNFIEENGNQHQQILDRIDCIQKKLDEKYSTNFKTEKLGGANIPYENIIPYLEELKNLREEVYRSIDESPTDEESSLLLLIDIRTLMIFSEKNYILAESYGDNGLVSDKNGFACNEAGYLINAAYYYNLSYGAGIQAYLKFDDLLNDYRQIPEVWSLIGINEEKPKFLTARLGDLKLDVEKNLIALAEFCLIDMGSGLTSIVNPQDYINGPPSDALISHEELEKKLEESEKLKKLLEEKGLNINYTTPES